MSTYSKPHLSITDQIALLRTRGLAIGDQAGAEHHLRTIGYYRLSAYWYPFRQLHTPPGAITPIRADAFLAGYSFEHALALHDFDERLKALLFVALEKIEVAARVQVAYVLGALNKFAHTDPGYFDPRFTNANPRTGVVGFAKWQTNHAQRIQESREDFTEHFKLKYGLPLPIWVAIELWDFGHTTSLLNGLHNRHQNAISGYFGMRRGTVFGSWLRSLNYVRNLCSHHCRLWNTNIVIKPTIDTSVTEFQHIHTVALHTSDIVARCYTTLCGVLYLIRSIEPTSQWPADLRALIDSFPTVPGITVSDMGFPQNWEAETIWQV